MFSMYEGRLEFSSTLKLFLQTNDIAMFNLIVKPFSAIINDS